MIVGFFNWSLTQSSPFFNVRACKLFLKPRQLSECLDIADDFGLTFFTVSRVRLGKSTTWHRRPRNKITIVKLIYNGTRHENTLDN